MSHLEPSYLRYIYDGLDKGELHPDNSAALPEGLTGLYEAAFEESKPARERQKLLENFAIWALLKKDVSAQFVAEILDVPTQEIIDFIATYSNWYTSPESGKYQLYHERLKVYLLQKLSEQEIATLHNKLVSRLEQALANQKQDEFELYGLEFLSNHYYIDAYSSELNKLFDFVLNDKIIERQIKISNGFKWSQNGLRNGIRFGVIMQSQNVVDCGLLLVSLFYQEQNDIERIISLALDNKIELSIDRIDCFGISNEQVEKKIISSLLLIDSIGTEISSKNKITLILGYLDKFEVSCFEFLFPINFLTNVIKHVKHNHLDCEKIYHLYNFNLNDDLDRSLIRDFNEIINHNNLNLDTLSDIENCICTNDLFSYFDKEKSTIFLNKLIDSESYNDLKENHLKEKDFVQNLEILILISRSKLSIDIKYFNDVLNEFIKSINQKIDTYYSPQDLTKIAICFYNINNIKDSENLILKSIEICSMSVESHEEYDCYSTIIRNLILHGCTELSYFAINNIPYSELQKYYLLLLSYINFENKNFLESKENIIDGIKYKSLKINNPITINNIKFNACINLIQNKKIKEAFALIKSIHEFYLKTILIEEILYSFNYVMNKKELIFLINEIPFINEPNTKINNWFQAVKKADFNLNLEKYLLEDIKHHETDYIKFISIICVNNEISFLELENSSINNIASLIFLNHFNIQGLEYLLVMRALNIIFMNENYDYKEIDSYHKSLNLKWAIDIKNQLQN